MPFTYIKYLSLINTDIAISLLLLLYDRQYHYYEGLVWECNKILFYSVIKHNTNEN